MKVLLPILLLGLLTGHATCEEEKAGTEDPCAQLEIEDCVHTEFSAYMKCIEETKAKRIKRQAQCPFTINSQQPAYYPAQQQAYQSPCNTMPCAPIQQQQIVPNAPVNTNAELITENHVEYLPQAPGQRHIIISTNNNSTREKYTSNLVPGHNITTVINLNNIINNTNIIDSPTNINNTNINNIHIYQNKTSTTGGKYGLGYNEKGSCCFAVRPKTCRKTTNGPKCRHHHHKTCGPTCTSRIVHAQVRRRCTSHSGCHRRTVHIPQPQPPRCYSTYYWPYTVCGGYQPSSCDGCYDHYGYGYENYYGGYDNSRCDGCYDDGYDQGPLYRRGPVLRPTHYHETPCEITGTCDDRYYSNQNGYFGHDRINPAFHEDEFAYFDGDENDFGRVFNISTQNASDEEGNYDAGESGDFAIQSRKCRIVEESDGSIVIRNCTLDDLDNQYAGSHSETYQEPDRRNVRRSSAPYYNYPPPPPPMYYPAPPPYMSPYMAPPPREQHRRPYRYENDDDDDGYDSNEDDNDFDNEVDYRPKTKSLVKKRQQSKQQANRFPIDEEDLDSFKDDHRVFDVYSAENYQ